MNTLLDTINGFIGFVYLFDVMLGVIFLALLMTVVGAVLAASLPPRKEKTKGFQSHIFNK